MRERGATPRGALDPSAYYVRSVSQVLGRDESWMEALQPMIEAPTRQASQVS
jgi:hypothetical protein